MRKFNRSVISHAALEGRPANLDDGRPAEDMIAVAEGVPEEIIELNEASEEVEALDADRIELEDAADGLEALRVSVEETLGERGMDAQAATFMRHAVESYTSRLNIKVTLPSQEAYGETGSKLQTTRVSLEGLTSVLENIWAWIIEVLTSTRAKIKDYYERTWAAAPRQKAQAEKILEQLNAITKGPDAEKSKLKISSSMANKLSIDGKFSGNFADALKKNSAVAKQLFTSHTSAATAWAGEVVAEVGRLDFGKDGGIEAALEAISKKGFAAPEDNVANVSVGGDKRFENLQGVEVKKSAELLGGRALFFQTPTGEAATTADAFVAIGKTAYTIDAFSDDPKAIENEQEIDVPAVAELKAICEEVITAADEIMKFKRGFEATDKVKRDAIAAQKKLKGTVKDTTDLDSGVQSMATKAVKLLGIVPTLIDQPNQGYSKYLLGTGSVALSFAAKAAGQYK